MNIGLWNVYSNEIRFEGGVCSERGLITGESDFHLIDPSNFEINIGIVYRNEVLPLDFLPNVVHYNLLIHKEDNVLTVFKEHMQWIEH